MADISTVCVAVTKKARLQALMSDIFPAVLSKHPPHVTTNDAQYWLFENVHWETNEDRQLMYFFDWLDMHSDVFGPGEYCYIHAGENHDHFYRRGDLSHFGAEVTRKTELNLQGIHHVVTYVQQYGHVQGGGAHKDCLF